MANLAGRAQLVTDDHVIDIAAASEGRLPADPMEVLARWDEVVAWAEQADSADRQVLDQLKLEAPSPRPRQVFAVASNYRDRPVILETPTDLPIIFTKFPGSVVGPYADVPLPTDSVDWEVELVVVVGRNARAVPVEKAWSAVAGVTIGQDFSERRLQLGGPVKQFSLGKSFPNFGPTGPVLVTPDEFVDMDDLHLLCSVNGEVVQDAKTSQMIFPVPELVSRLSMVCTLFPGDLIFTGTPAGLGMMMQPPRYLKVGDEVRSHITGIGELRNRCVTPFH
jgi:2-keto-4-pentenoate hydratase/2-oxohepta-3-ene-1,7-dioic acid hydratase in catechol pathway